MAKTYTLEVPEPWLQGLDLSEELVLQEVLMLGIRQYRIERALSMYKAGLGSLGYAAHKTGIAKQDLIREARARGIEPAYDEETVQEELGL
jgi:predicted HTH domain antitoxin